MDAMQKLANIEAAAKQVAGIYGTATDEIDGHKVRAEVVPNTRGFTKKALARVDWYVDGKRVARKDLRAALGAA